MGNSTEDKSTDELIYPVFAMDNITILPGVTTGVTVYNEPETVKLIKEVYREQKEVLLVTKNQHAMYGIFPVGTVGKILSVKEISDSNIEVEISGIIKGNIINARQEGSVLYATVKTEDYTVMRKEAENDPVAAEAMKRELQENMHKYMDYSGAPAELKNVLLNKWDHIDDLTELMTAIMGSIPVDYRVKQAFLEISSLNPRFEILQTQILNEIDVLRVRKVIVEKVNKNLQKESQEHYLREQLKVINEELYGDAKGSDVEEFTEKLRMLDAPDDVKEKIEKEIVRLRKTFQNSSEAGVIRNYISTLLDIPWEKETSDTEDLDKVQESLDRDHYGLEKVKERIVDALAVINVTEAADIPIICLFGPPGTGKTSIAQSVAKALGKEFVRIALGGVKDEAELRGHRRTYVGALPGRIINGLIDAKVKNPVMLFDEIDKMGADYRGDPASAMLEILDGEQNTHFVDHYVELPVDLSQVLFICTANDLSTISQPLLDRMEIIELNSYTENEKMHIAKKHLVPKQIEKNGLKPSNIKFTDKALNIIISEYTAEAGVRNLERKIAEVCRKVVRELYDDGFITDKKITITQKNIETYLGKPKVIKPKINHKPLIGLVHGLAWTKVGGTVIEIEVNTMPGKGVLILTGQMGDVMKESARIALSCVRSVVKDKASETFFEKNDIHMHIPAGAVPKDGPSAGIAMATAIYSAVTGKKIRGDVAMTGEITLTGGVLPIGGLKEKMLAATKSGMKKIIVPEANRVDVDEFDDEIKGNLEIVYVTLLSQVLKETIID